MSEFHDLSGSLAERLGLRIRARRTEMRLTLAALSERAGVSISYLSAVEKGVNLPSLAMLAKITDALNIAIPALLADEGENRVRVGTVPRDIGLAEVSHPDLQLRIQILRAAPLERGEIALDTKGHDLFVYVLQGQVNILFAGEEGYQLDVGDALNVRSPDTLSWRTETGCCVLWSSCPI